MVQSGTFKEHWGTTYVFMKKYLTGQKWHFLGDNECSTTRKTICAVPSFLSLSYFTCPSMTFWNMSSQKTGFNISCNLSPNNKLSRFKSSAIDILFIFVVVLLLLFWVVVFLFVCCCFFAIKKGLTFPRRQLVWNNKKEILFLTFFLSSSYCPEMLCLQRLNVHFLTDCFL